jgi:hypothetical protein
VRIFTPLKKEHEIHSLKGKAPRARSKNGRIRRL